MKKVLLIEDANGIFYPFHKIDSIRIETNKETESYFSGCLVASVGDEEIGFECDDENDEEILWERLHQRVKQLFCAGGIFISDMCDAYVVDKNGNVRYP